MRPQTATPKQSKHVLFNQMSGNYFVLGDQGKHVKVNRRGDLATKFTNGFSGFFNFKERKNRSMKDRALMYTQPKIDYDKENSFVCPIGTKFSGYAQSPYNLKGEIPHFLGDATFKKTCEARNSQKLNIQQNRSSQLSPFSPSMTQTKTLNKFQSLKLFKTENSSSLNFDLIKEKINEKPAEESLGRLLKKRQNTTEDKQQKSIIMKASDTYSSATIHKRIKSMNMGTTVSFHRQNNPHKSTHQTSYFEQSLSNIERTETPNYLHSNFSFSEFASHTFNQTSVKPSCYKSSCHNLKYVSKRRYVKAKKENNTVGLKEYETGLKSEEKEKRIVDRLKEELKIYQPVIKQPEVHVEDGKKKGVNEKGKKTGLSTAAKK